MANDFMTFGETARALGVGESTLRRWDEKGVLKASRNPISNARRYREEDVNALKARLEARSEGGDSWGK